MTKKLTYKYLHLKRGSVPKILELACGTGNILNVFPKTFKLSGLDLSKGMLALAKKKVPHATYYHQDMSHFTVPEVFDGILCIFDSINHLHKFSEWRSMFAAAARHLRPGGIFIFDMNTVHRLEALPLAPAYMRSIGNDLLCIKVLKGGRNMYTARFELFRNFKSKKRILFEEEVSESSFSTSRVEDALNKQFDILKKIDPVRKRVTLQTGRIFYVCQRRAKVRKK